MSSLMHIHLFAAIAWIGGSIFMFILGISLRDKEKQKEVYPHVGPIFGYFESVSLVILVSTGVLLILNNGLFDLLFTDDNSDVINYLKSKLLVVSFVIIATIIHFVIAMRTNTKQRTPLENIISRGTSLFIFFANIFILHYAIMIRSIL